MKGKKKMQNFHARNHAKTRNNNIRRRWKTQRNPTCGRGIPDPRVLIGEAAHLAESGSVVLLPARNSL